MWYILSTWQTRCYKLLPISIIYHKYLNEMCPPVVGPGSSIAIVLAILVKGLGFGKKYSLYNKYSVKKYLTILY